MPNMSRRNSWIITVPLAGATLAYVMLVFLPQRKAIGELGEQRQAKELFLQQASGIAAQIVQQQRELDQAARYVQRRRQCLPEEKDLAALYARVHAAVNQAGARTTRFDPQPPVVYERLRRDTLVLGCKGTFRQTNDLLGRLETMLVPPLVETFRIEKVGNSGKEASIEVMLVNYSENPDSSDYTKNPE